MTIKRWHQHRLLLFGAFYSGYLWLLLSHGDAVLLRVAPQFPDPVFGHFLANALLWCFPVLGPLMLIPRRRHLRELLPLMLMASAIALALPKLIAPPIADIKTPAVTNKAAPSKWIMT